MYLIWLIDTKKVSLPLVTYIRLTADVSTLTTVHIGGAESADLTIFRTDNDGPKKQGWKMRDLGIKIMTGTENARPDKGEPIVGSTRPPTLSHNRGCHMALRSI